MKATQTLMNEHRVIERVLTALEIAAGRVKQGEESVQPSLSTPRSSSKTLPTAVITTRKKASFSLP
jgi:hypothetical protein